jgi:quercetin dioxygenase-like cupin family protein
MRHPAISDAIRETAALYSLGALSQHEARAFEEHLEQGCEVCKAELDSFDMTVGALSLAALEQEPPLRVRDELLSRINGNERGESKPSEPIFSDAIVSLHSNEGEWKRLCKGVQMKTLYTDKATGLATSLVRMDAGTGLPMHRHTGVEQFYILEGDCYVHGERLGPGDYHRAEAGSIHETTYTIEGTLFLLIAPESYEILDAR